MEERPAVITEIRCDGCKRVVCYVERERGVTAGYITCPICFVLRIYKITFRFTMAYLRRQDVGMP